MSEPTSTTTVRSQRDWPFLNDLANQVASLMRCGQMLGVDAGVAAADDGFEAVYVTEDGAECRMSLGSLNPFPEKASSDETTTRPAVSRELANPEVRTWPVARRNGN